MPKGNPHSHYGIKGTVDAYTGPARTYGSKKDLAKAKKNDDLAQSLRDKGAGPGMEKFHNESITAVQGEGYKTYKGESQQKERLKKNASAKAKKANPRLKRVKSKKKK